MAELTNGVRIHRGGDFSESLPDVISPLNSIFPEVSEDHGLVLECKYRSNQPWINKYKSLKKKYPKYEYLILKMNCFNSLTGMDDTMYIMPIELLKEFHTRSNKIINLNIIPPTYLSDYCNQSRKYTNDPDIRDSIQLLYYKATKDRKRLPFRTFTSMAVIGQKHDRVRLVCFFQSEIKFLVNA